MLYTLIVAFFTLITALYIATLQPNYPDLPF